MTEFEIEQVRKQILRKYEAKGIGQGAKAINELLETASKITAEMIAQCLSQALDESHHKTET